MEKLCRNNGLTGPGLNNDISLRQLNNFTFNITDFDFVTNPTVLYLRVYWAPMILAAIFLAPRLKARAAPASRMAMEATMTLLKKPMFNPICSTPIIMALKMITI